MKKLLFILTLLILSTDSMAEWTKVHESEEQGGYTIYADLTSIGRPDGRVNMWTLIDYKVEQKDTGAYFLSKKKSGENMIAEVSMSKSSRSNYISGIWAEANSSVLTLNHRDGKKYSRTARMKLNGK